MTLSVGLRYWYSRVASSVWSARISPVSRSVATARPWSMSSSAMRPALCLPRLKIRRLPAMLFCVTQPRLSILWILGPYGDVRSRRFGSFVLGDGLPARRPGAEGRRLAAPLLVEFCLRPGREFGVGQGLALGAVRFSGGSSAERAVRPLLVVDVPEFGELFVELVDRGRRGTGGEPLLQGAVVAFDLALRLGVAGQDRCSGARPSARACVRNAPGWR